MLTIALVALGIAIFAIGIILTFNPPSNNGPKQQLHVPSGDIAKLKEDYTMLSREIQECRKALSGALAQKNSVEVISENLKELAVRFDKQKEDLQSAIDSQKSFFEQALKKKSEELKALDEELQRTWVEVAFCTQSVETGRKNLNAALSQNRIFNYKLKEDMRTVLQESQKSRRELRKHGLAIDCQKDDIQQAFAQKKRELESFEDKLKEMKRQVMLDSLDIKASMKAVNDVLAQCKALELQKRQPMPLTTDESRLRAFTEDLDKMKKEFVAFMNYFRNRADND